MSAENETLNATSIHQSVGYWAGLLARSMEAEFTRRLAPSGLTRMSYAVLGAIAFDGKSTPSSIADFLGLDRATVTRSLDKLEARNLIGRDRGLSDRRSVSIIVRPEGAALAKELHAHSCAVNAQFTADLSAGDAERFVELVKAMLTQTKQPLESL